ncbi:MAG: hypothetical protein NZ890_17360 [Myxococcota bacterium]|nr:hypothetical protein [Myxococcota bacterium]
MEIFGQIRVPPSIKARGHLVVHVSNEDCTKPGAVMLGSAPAVDGHIAIEVFPRWGSDITICGALEEAPDRPVRFYGKAAGRFHAEAPGEVIFRDVVVELKKGPPLRLPVVYNPPQ